MSPFWIFLIVLVGLPLFELYLLIEVGSFIGVLPTILLSIFTAILGGTLMRQQGISTAMRAQASMARGEVPAIEMIEGVVVFLAGFVLLFPGFLTDALGFLLLIPPVRRLMVLYFLKRARMMHPVQAGSKDVTKPSGYIEGEYRREE